MKIKEFIEIINKINGGEEVYIQFEEKELKLAAPAIIMEDGILKIKMQEFDPIPF